MNAHVCGRVSVVTQRRVAGCIERVRTAIRTKAVNSQLVAPQLQTVALCPIAEVFRLHFKIVY